MPYSDQVDAEPVRKHVEALLAGGMSVAQIQNLSGVDRTSIRVLLGEFPRRTRSRQVRALTASRLLRTRLDIGSAIQGLVPATGTRRRLQALGAIGWSQRELVRMLGGSQLQIARNDAVLAVTAQLVGDLYQRLSDTPGPSSRTAQLARNRGWLPPIWWDNDQIDDLAYEPDGIRTYLRNGKLLDDVSLPRAVRIELMTERGLSPEQIAERIGAPLKYVHRDARDLGIRRRCKTNA